MPCLWEPYGKFLVAPYDVRKRGNEPVYTQGEVGGSLTADAKGASYWHGFLRGEHGGFPDWHVSTSNLQLRTLCQISCPLSKCTAGCYHRWNERIDVLLFCVSCCSSSVWITSLCQFGEREGIKMGLVGASLDLRNGDRDHLCEVRNREVGRWEAQKRQPD